MNIRYKLTLQFTVIVASMFILFSLLIYFFSATFREQEFDKRLVDKGLTTARLYIDVKEVDANLLRIIDKNNLTALQHEKITIYNSKQEKIYSTDDDPEIPISKDFFKRIDRQHKILFNHNENESLGLLYKSKDSTHYIIVSAYDEFGIKKLKNLRFILFVGVLISILVIVIAGRIYSGQALFPISNIINEVKSIRGDNTDIRVSEGNGKDELAQLAKTFNEMLERISVTLNTQKSFVSNASHELRTPLSIISTQLELTLKNKNSEEYYETLEAIRDEIKNLIILSNGLLEIAHAESLISSFSLQSNRIDELVYESISALYRKYPNQKILCELNVSEENSDLLLLDSVEYLLQVCFTNIIDNACKYSNGLPVNIKITSDKNSIIVEIKDYGIGIPSNNLPDIFKPFYRGSNVGIVNGHGIGLSLVEKIIRVHNGFIKIESKVNYGTTVSLIFQKNTYKYF